MPSIYSFEIISAVVRGGKSKGRPDTKILFEIAASVADADAAVNSNGIKTLLANGVSRYFINVKPAVINGLRKMINSPS